MKRYIRSLEAYSSAGLVLISFLALLGLYVVLNFTHAPFSILSLKAESGGKTILNLLPYYDAAIAYEHIASYSAKAVRLYHWIIAIDVLALIPVYVVFLATGIFHSGTLALRHYRKGILYGLALLPALAGVVNLIEDGIIVYLIGAFPQRHETLAALCGMLTTTKTLLITISMLLVAVFYIVIGTSRLLFMTGARKCHI